MIDLFAIPEFLDRSTWTSENFEASERRWREIERERDAVIIAQRRREKAVATRQKRQREAAEEKKRERAALREQRNIRRREKIEDREAVQNLIASGEITLGQMVKRSSIPKQRLSKALRFLVKHGAIRKATPRTYAI